MHMRTAVLDVEHRAPFQHAYLQPTSIPTRLPPVSRIRPLVEVDVTSMAPLLDTLTRAHALYSTTASVNTLTDRVTPP